MGREIRKVKKGWEHPRYTEGRWAGDYHPMHDEFYGDALAEWEEDKKQWLAGTHPHLKTYEQEPTIESFNEWFGEEAPDPEYYRAEKWTEEACCFQYYQTVSEGTPLSPVFETLQELEDWLVKEEGHSRESAKRFCEAGHAPSFMMNMPEGKIASGVDIYDLLPPKD